MDANENDKALAGLVRKYVGRRMMGLDFDADEDAYEQSRRQSLRSHDAARESAAVGRD
jgi:hypothetical protein